jgi:urease accessory protein
MKATTVVEVAVDRHGRTQLHRLHSEPPLGVRATAGSGSGGTLVLQLVGTAAGPLGGDVLSLQLHIGAGARVRIRSVAAQLAQPGPRGEPSVLDVDAEIADHAAVDWWPQPTVSVAASDHRTTTRLDVGDGVTVRCVEELVLGRHREPPGRITLRQRVERRCAPLLDHETELADGGWRGPGAHGTFGHLLSAVLVGRDVPAEPCASVRPDGVSAVLPVTGGCTLVTATDAAIAGIRRSLPGNI